MGLQQKCTPEKAVIIKPRMKFDFALTVTISLVPQKPSNYWKLSFYKKHVRVNLKNIKQPPEKETKKPNPSLAPVQTPVLKRAVVENVKVHEDVI